MTFISRYGVLLLGLLSPVAAAYLGFEAYARLTRASMDRNEDFVYRLTMVVVAMAVPFVVTMAVALLSRGDKPMPKTAKVGVGLATLSLALTWVPISSLVDRTRQAQNLALEDVAAPLFETTDIEGNTHRLADYRGKLVVLNIWATWCGPCRWEMPQLDRMYRELGPQGLIVLGLSVEDVALQRQFVEQVPVSYPLLTTNGDVPSMYKDIQRYPAMFIIDRTGQLRLAPGPDEPFENLETAVRTLLMATAQAETPPTGD